MCKLTSDELADRRKIVNEAINSVSLEGFSLSKSQIENFEKYAAGKISLEQMINFTLNEFNER